MEYKVGDKIRFYRKFDERWRYTTIEKISYTPNESPKLWGHWHDLNGPPDPDMSFIRANTRTLELVKRGGTCPMEARL